MIDTPQTSPDRTLVTFALFAYNQEKYIREAVEGAFSQTYEPLEIILSDDCSSDRTFSIMQEMAATYTGPHKVKVRRNEINYGTALHIDAIATQCNGSIFVVAAGDDISSPYRCSSIVKRWKDCKTKVSCIHSGAFFFDEVFGRNEDFRPPREKSIIHQAKRLEFIMKDKLPFLSPTCAYSTELFKAYPPIIGGSIIEDGVMAFRSLDFGSVLSINEPLVWIRRQDETSGTGNSILNAYRWNRFILSRIISYNNILRDLRSTAMKEDAVARLQGKYLKKIRHLSHFFIRENYEIRFIYRVFMLVRYISIYPTSARFLNRVANGFIVSGFSNPFLFSFLRKLLR